MTKVNLCPQDLSFAALACRELGERNYYLQSDMERVANQLEALAKTDIEPLEDCEVYIAEPEGECSVSEEEMLKSLIRIEYELLHAGSEMWAAEEYQKGLESLIEKLDLAE